MEEILRNIAQLQGWSYLYGRSDFQNLFDSNTQEVSMFVDPIEIESEFNEAGVTEKTIHSGNFMLLLSSDIDEVDYDTRYQNYIKPLISSAMSEIKKALQCNNSVMIQRWKIVEVINMLDNNGDGIICTFQVAINED